MKKRSISVWMLGVAFIIALLISMFMPIEANAKSNGNVKSGSVSIARKSFKTLVVGNGSSLKLKDNVIKYISPVKNIKSVKIKSPDKAISAYDEGSTSKGVPGKLLKFKKSGYHSVDIQVKCKSGKTVSTKVKFKVINPLSTYVKGLGDSQSNIGEKFNPLKGVSYTKKIKSVKVKSSKLNVDCVGKYKITYTITGKSNDTLNVVRKIQIKDIMVQTPLATRIYEHVEGLSDRVFFTNQSGLTLWDRITADATVKTVTCDKYGTKTFSSPNPLVSKKPYYKDVVTYTVTFKDGVVGKVKHNIWFLDSVTATDLADCGAWVYKENNTIVGIPIEHLLEATLLPYRYIYKKEPYTVYVCDTCGEEFIDSVEVRNHLQGSLDCNGKYLTFKAPEVRIICPFTWSDRDTTKNRASTR